MSTCKGAGGLRNTRILMDYVQKSLQSMFVVGLTMKCAQSDFGR